MTSEKDVNISTSRENHAKIETAVGTKYPLHCRQQADMANAVEKCAVNTAVT